MRSGESCLLTQDIELSKPAGMMWLQESAVGKNGSVNRMMTLRALIAVIWLALLLQPAFAAAAEPRVLLLEPQPADKASKLSMDTRQLVAKTLNDYVRRVGDYVVARPAQGQTYGCDALDLGCVARAAQSHSELVLGSKLQVNVDNTIYLTLTLLDTQTPERVVSQNLAFGTPGRKKELSNEESDQFATKIEASVGALFRSFAATASPSPPRQAVPPPDGQGKLTVEVHGRGSVQSDPPGFQCAQPECVFPGDPVGSLTLVAVPGRARTASWSGVSCLNSVLAEPLRCQLNLASGLRVKVSFERSLGRKIGAGVLWGLSIAGLATSFAFYGLHGQVFDAGRQVYNTGKAGTLSLILGTASGVAGGLVFFL